MLLLPQLQWKRWELGGHITKGPQAQVLLSVGCPPLLVLPLLVARLHLCP